MHDNLIQSLVLHLIQLVSLLDHVVLRPVSVHSSDGSKNMETDTRSLDDDGGIVLGPVLGNGVAPVRRDLRLSLFDIGYFAR